MPDTAHVIDALPPHFACEDRAGAIPPQPHRFVASIDAALEQQILHVPKRQRKPHVHQDHQPDDLRGRVASLERRRRLRSQFAGHGATVSAPCPVRLTLLKGAFALTEPARWAGLHTDLERLRTRDQNFPSHWDNPQHEE